MPLTVPMVGERVRNGSGIGFLTLVIVALEIMADIGLLIWAVASGKDFLLPTAVVRLMAMAVLGGAVIAGKTWGRWGFAGLMATTAVAGIVVGLVSFEHGAKFRIGPLALLLAAAYGAGSVVIASSGRDRPVSH